MSKARDDGYAGRDAPTLPGQGGSARDEIQPRTLSDPGAWGVGDGEGAGASSAQARASAAEAARTLGDGSRVAVIGGGPAGSLFSHFLLRSLDIADTRVVVDIYEPRLFTHSGPSGCNHCGGVISESLVQILATEGINLPDDVVQRGIDSYQMHMDVGQVRIATPLEEKRIATVYRGNGPRHAPPATTTGFDRYLLEMAVAAGATWRRQLVSRVSRCAGRWQLGCADGSSASYDLLVVACGINSALLSIMESADTGYAAPVPMRTFIAEFRLGKAVIESTLGTSMHVFLLDLPGLQFAALIPKGDYVTLCILGDQVDQQMIDAFFNSQEVRDCFPERRVPQNVCHCLAGINVGPARRPYGDGIVYIGDSGVARLYKDGLGSAYRTAKAAAVTAAFQGISARDFARGYRPACRTLERDNAIGQFIFAVCHLIQRLRFARRAVLRMVQIEQTVPGRQPRMSGVLWDVFTGSAPYNSVLLRTLHPVFIASLVWNLVVANLPGVERTRAGVSTA